MLLVLLLECKLKWLWPRCLLKLAPAEELEDLYRVDIVVRAKLAPNQQIRQFTEITPLDTIFQRNEENKFLQKFPVLTSRQAT